ncbi:hypothetical protein [Reyranella sp.]|uniref:hypothetical protein n=1 Tax=Reyranella sp. TaxID=1929291 RepID=UPI003D0E94EE
MRDAIALSGGNGVVIGTEYEAGKATAAQANVAQAGLEQFIDLREGDLRETLLDRDGSASARAAHAPPATRRRRHLRQHQCLFRGLRRLLRVPERSGEWLPHDDPALRPRSRMLRLSALNSKSRCSCK